MKVNWTDEQQQAMKRLYGQFVSAGDLVFNVGAHKGDRTAVFLELGAMIVALEPQPELAAALRERFCKEKAVEVIQAAAGAKEGTATLIVFPGMHSASCEAGWIAAGGGGMKVPINSWDTPIEVKQITLDGLIAYYGFPDFIKIDVEGYEREVVKGLSSWDLAQPVPLLCFESTISYLEAALDCLWDLHMRLGFTRFNYMVQENMKLEVDDWVGADEMVAILKGMPLRASYCDVFAR